LAEKRGSEPAEKKKRTRNGPQLGDHTDNRPRARVTTPQQPNTKGKGIIPTERSRKNAESVRGGIETWWPHAQEAQKRK